jgi:hypothetical protein
VPLPLILKLEALAIVVAPHTHSRCTHDAASGDEKDTTRSSDAALGEKKMDGGLKTFGLDCATSPSGFT